MYFLYLLERTILLDPSGKSLSPKLYDEPNIEDWFAHISMPTKEEGFSEVIQVDSQLFTNKQSFNNQSIIIDLSGLLQLDSDGFTTVKYDNTVSTLQEFAQTNRGARLVVTFDLIIIMLIILYI